MTNKLHYINQNGLVYSKGNKIYFDLNGSNSLKIDTVLPDSLLLLKRLLRNGIHIVKECENILIVVVKKRILFFKNKQFLHETTINRGSKPLKQGVECLNGKMYYGDYWGNPEREAVHLYSVDLRTFQKEIVYSFSHARHIHFVQTDSINDRTLLIGTGDSDSESGLYQFSIDSGEMLTLAEGSQKFRAVSVLQENDQLIWGSDAPDEQNYIYRLNRITNKLETICEIDGPAYYSTKNSKDEMFMASTVEDRNKHNAMIYKSTDTGKSWSVYKTFIKDRWHPKYFGYGVIEFIDGQKNFDKLFYNVIGLKEQK